MIPTSPSVGKVLLVNHAGYFLTTNTFLPDNSLASLAAALGRHGVDVEIIDYQGPRDVGRVMNATARVASAAIVERLEAGDAVPLELVREYQADRRRGEAAEVERRTVELLEKIERERVGMVGFKLWAGEGLLGAIAMARAIRRAFPAVRLVGGGPAVQYAGDLLRVLAPELDHLVAGDGEDEIVRLATGTRAAPRAPDDASPELDRLPFPTYDPAVYPNVDDFFRVRILDESRGCFNRCAFCAHPHLNGGTVRERTAARVVDEMQRTVETTGIRHFRLSGSNPRWALVNRIAQEILDRRLDVRWAVFSSMNNVDAADLPRLAAAGLRSLFFGIESGDREVLRRSLSKNNRSQDHVVHVCRTAMACGIFLSLSFIVPTPGETPESQGITLRLIDEIFADSRHGSVLVLPPFLTPGTRWWTQMERYGFELEPGLDRDGYVLRGLTLSNDFLMPRDAFSDYGYLLRGKRVPELLAACEAFTRQVQQRGITTLVDDTAFLVADLGGIAPEEHKRLITNALIRGGADALTDYVGGLNRGGRAEHRPPRRSAARGPRGRTLPHAYLS